MIQPAVVQETADTMQEVIRQVPVIQRQTQERVVEVPQVQTVERVVQVPQVQIEEVVQQVTVPLYFIVGSSQSFQSLDLAHL